MRVISWALTFIPNINMFSGLLGLNFLIMRLFGEGIAKVLRTYPEIYFENEVAEGIKEYFNT